MLRRGGQSTALPTGCAPTDAALDSVGPRCCHAQFTAHQHVQGLPHTAAPQPGSPTLCHSKGHFLFKCGTWHFLLLNFIKSLLSHSASLSTSFWMAAMPLSIPTGATQVWCHLQTLWPSNLLVPPGWQIKVVNKWVPSCFLQVSRHLQCKALLHWDFGSTT